MYAKRRAEILAYNRQWKAKNRAKVKATHERWLRTTNGQKHLLDLPTTAPDSLLESIKLIRALKKEIHEHQ